MPTSLEQKLKRLESSLAFFNDQHKKLVEKQKAVLAESKSRIAKKKAEISMCKKEIKAAAKAAAPKKPRAKKVKADA